MNSGLQRAQETEDEDVSDPDTDKFPSFRPEDESAFAFVTDEDGAMEESTLDQEADEGVSDNAATPEDPDDVVLPESVVSGAVEDDEGDVDTHVAKHGRRTRGEVSVEVLAHVRGLDEALDMLVRNKQIRSRWRTGMLAWFLPVGSEGSNNPLHLRSARCVETALPKPDSWTKERVAFRIGYQHEVDNDGREFRLAGPGGFVRDPATVTCLADLTRKASGDEYAAVFYDRKMHLWASAVEGLPMATSPDNEADVWVQVLYRMAFGRRARI